MSVQEYYKADEIGDSVFAYCCRHPIEHLIYEAFIKNGLWPEDIGSGSAASPPPDRSANVSQNTQSLAPRREGMREYTREDREDREQAESIGKNVIGFVSPKPGQEETLPEQRGDESGHGDSVEHIERENMPAMPEEVIGVQITLLVGDAEKWLDSIGRKIAVKEHADKLANFAVAAAAIEKQAEESRETEKRPFLEGGRAVDAKWTPIVQRAGKIKSNLKTMLEPWLREQRRKAVQEAADAQKAKEAAEVAGELPPAISEPPSRSVAGTRGHVALKTRKVYQIDNLREAADFIAKLNDPPEVFVEGVRAAAERLIKAGVSVPGVSRRTEDVVA